MSDIEKRMGWFFDALDDFARGLYPSVDFAEMVHKRIASLEAELEAARKCSVCGGTDVICAKGWQTDRNALLEQNTELRSKLTRLERNIESWIAREYDDVLRQDMQAALYSDGVNQEPTGEGK